MSHITNQRPRHAMSPAEALAIRRVPMPNVFSLPLLATSATASRPIPSPPARGLSLSPRLTHCFPTPPSNSHLHYPPST